MEGNSMTEKMQRQKLEARKRRVFLSSLQIRFFIGTSIVLFIVALLLLWALTRLHIISSPWSDLLNLFFQHIYALIGTISAVIIGFITANNKELFQRIFPDATKKEVASETAKENTSAVASSGAPTNSHPEASAQTQHAGKILTDSYRESVQIEIIEPVPFLAPPTDASTVFLFNEHLPHPREFYGRKLECEALIHRVRSRAATSIVGPRRIGKTWLLEYLVHIAPTRLGPQYRVGYVDATLPGNETVSGFTNSTLEQLGIRITPGDAHLNLGVLLDAVDRLRKNNLTPILCIDEFEGLNNREEFKQVFFTGLRAVCQRGLGLVTVSKTTLFDIVGDDGYTSGFFNIFDTYTLTAFDSKEARGFVQAKGDQANLTKRERSYLLNYSRLQDQQQWLPLRLQLTGKMLLEDKGESSLRSNDVDYWLDFKDRLEKRYRAVVH